MVRYIIQSWNVLPSCLPLNLCLFISSLSWERVMCSTLPLKGEYLKGLVWFNKLGDHVKNYIVIFHIDDSVTQEKLALVALVQDLIPETPVLVLILKLLPGHPWANHLIFLIQFFLICETDWFETIFFLDF